MDQLQIFSSEVSRVAREVGTEGILGGQAQISGVDGTWKELTDNGMSLLQSPNSPLVLALLAESMGSASIGCITNAP